MGMMGITNLQRKLQLARRADVVRKNNGLFCFVIYVNKPPVDQFSREKNDLFGVPSLTCASVRWPLGAQCSPCFIFHVLYVLMFAHTYVCHTHVCWYSCFLILMFAILMFAILIFGHNDNHICHTHVCHTHVSWYSYLLQLTQNVKLFKA